MNKIYVNGIFSNPVHQKAPEFIKGKISVNVEVLAKWLQDNKNLADEKGYIRMTIMEGREGKRYVEVDTWKPEAAQAPKKETPAVVVPEMEYGEVADPSNIPF